MLSHITYTHMLTSIGLITPRNLMSIVGGQIQDWVSSRGACNSRLSRETTKSQVAFKVSKDGGPPPSLGSGVYSSHGMILPYTLL